jgi:hypothetical protein
MRKLLNIEIFFDFQIFFILFFLLERVRTATFDYNTDPRWDPTCSTGDHLSPINLSKFNSSYISDSTSGIEEMHYTNLTLPLIQNINNGEKFTVSNQEFGYIIFSLKGYQYKFIGILMKS